MAFAAAVGRKTAPHGVVHIAGQGERKVKVHAMGVGECARQSMRTWRSVTTYGCVYAQRLCHSRPTTVRAGDAHTHCTDPYFPLPLQHANEFRWRGGSVAAPSVLNRLPAVYKLAAALAHPPSTALGAGYVLSGGPRGHERGGLDRV